MKKHHIITVALFGSLWGMLEATLGGVLHLAHVPFTGTVMASIGFALLFATHRAGVRPARLFLVSVVAASFKLLDAPLFGLAPFNIMIVNPAIAIASQGLAFALVVRFWRLPDRFGALLPRMVVASGGAMLLFNGFSLGVMGHVTNHTLHPWNAAIIQLPLTALGAALLARGWARLVSHTPFTLTPRWQVTATIACAVLAIGARILL